MISPMLAFSLGVIVGGLGGLLLTGLLLLLKERQMEIGKVSDDLEPSLSNADFVQMENTFEDTEDFLPEALPERQANVIFLDSLRH